MRKKFLQAGGVLIFAIVMTTACTNRKTEEGQDVQTLYEEGIEDAVFADDDEIMELVSLTKEDKRVEWDDEGRVLLLTLHNYPDSYPTGETVTLEWGVVWAFVEKDMETAYAKEAKYGEDSDLILKQLIGLPPDGEYSTVTGFWVDPKDVVRPAYQKDPTDGSMTNELPEDVDADFKEWFDGNILDSYFYGAYPWTRLGYTYNWSGHGSEYGVTEFLIKQGTEVEVVFTESADEFVEEL